MSKHDDLVYIGHMLDQAYKIQGFMQGKNRQDYDNDEILRLALTRLLGVMDDTSSNTSKAFRTAHPQIPWHQLIGIRHRMAHDYLNVDYGVVWSAITNELPPLVAELETLVPPGNP